MISESNIVDGLCQQIGWVRIGFDLEYHDHIIVEPFNDFKMICINVSTIMFYASGKVYPNRSSKEIIMDTIMMIDDNNTKQKFYELRNLDLNDFLTSLNYFQVNLLITIKIQFKTNCFFFFFYYNQNRYFHHDL